MVWWSSSLVLLFGQQLALSGSVEYLPSDSTLSHIRLLGFFPFRIFLVRTIVKGVGGKNTNEMKNPFYSSSSLFFLPLVKKMHLTVLGRKINKRVIDGVPGKRTNRTNAGLYYEPADELFFFDIKNETVLLVKKK